MTIALEIAVTSVAGALVARDNGADRVELCSALELGGVTPSQGLVEATLSTGVPVHALVRVRPGNFVYDRDEVATMVAEVRALAAAGVAGVVIGALTSDGALDHATVALLADTARAHSPLGGAIGVTLHRAIDQAADPVAVVEALASLGVSRVLTSGAAASAGDGVAMLARLVSAAGTVQVMAGGGVTVEAIPSIVAAGVAAVHLSAKRQAPAVRRAGWVPLGSAGTDPESDAHFVTDGAVVRAARRALGEL